MRLIRTSSPLKLGLFQDNEVPNLEYAILSHRWETEEVSFQEMIEPTDEIRQKKGYFKIKSFCERARADGFEYAWVDTCCINKESSAELSESINSMFRWYREAAKCYAFMTDVDSLDHLSNSVWFTRGWTLQELVAPQDMVFLASDWSEIGSRQELGPKIEQITKIDTALLLGEKRLDQFCISKRMSWASTRETTRAEDRAYCLMGIFNVNMPLLYGEGNNAFIRLQEEIMKDSDDETLFAWEREGVSDEKPCGLLAPSPNCFANSGDVVPYNFSEDGLPFTLTNRGIRMQSPLIPPDSITTTLILQCIASSALVGIGISSKPNAAKDKDDFVRITSTLIRDVPFSMLLSAVLDTVYIRKTFVAPSVDKSVLQDRDSDSSSEDEPEIADRFFHRKIQPRGRFKKLILCFDDTKSPYAADGNASNVTKIHRMLDRREGSQVGFYQSWGPKTTLESLTMDGYRFLMEFYQSGDEVSLFGFSKGCQAVQTLCEIIEYIGVLFSSHHKMIDEVWSTFSTFKCQGGKAKHRAFEKMIYFRESFSRPTRRIQFIGLFDPVDIAPQKNRDPSSRIKLLGRIIRHAIAIDEKQTVLRPTLATLATEEELETPEDFQQVWFPGAHEDLGGTMMLWADELLPLSHLPLVWMANEAKKAGLRFRAQQELMRKVSTAADDMDLLSGHYKNLNSESDGAEMSSRRRDFIDGLHDASERGLLHDELKFGHGWSAAHVCKKRIKNLFFSRTFSQAAASKQGVREIPLDAAIHSSVLRRMRADSTYRPSNLHINDLDSLTMLYKGDPVRECFVHGTDK